MVEIDTSKLRRLRMESLLTRDELAQKSGVSWSTISKLEVSNPEEKPVRLETAKKLARALGVKRQELVLGITEGRPISRAG